MKKDETKKSQMREAKTKKRSPAKEFKLPKPNKNMVIWGGLGPWKLPKDDE
jgi:hypothetical protein